MDENRILIGQFKALYNGDPWIESSVIGTLKEVSAPKASAQPKAVANSIWQIVHHVACWRQHVLARIKGNWLESPADNYFSPLKDTSDRAWKTALDNLERTQEEWLSFLEHQYNGEIALRPYEGSNYNIRDLVHGILQHDSYHLGQLALLVKYDL